MTAADSSECIDPDKHSKAEFLFPETTRDFDKLPLEFKVLCVSFVCACGRAVWLSG